MSITIRGCYRRPRIAGSMYKWSFQLQLHLQQPHHQQRCDISSSAPVISSKLSDYTKFHVPPELIAQYPAVPRDSSRLMVVSKSKGTIEHCIFRDLPEILDSSYMLIANNSRVINCKLKAYFPHEHHDEPEKTRPIIIYLLKQLTNDTWLVSGDDVLETKQKGFQIGVSGPSLKLKLIGTLTKSEASGDKSFEMSFAVDLASSSSSPSFSNEIPLRTLLSSVAEIPLPPYIDADTASKVVDPNDVYQTVYAREDGSVAAPTAGLHFTEDVFDRLQAKGIQREEITLHVGLGTFGHVTVDDLSRHNMHSEEYVLSTRVAEAINKHRQTSPANKLLTVGTTSTRVLESCATLTSPSPSSSSSSPSGATGRVDGEDTTSISRIGLDGSSCSSINSSGSSSRNHNNGNHNNSNHRDKYFAKAQSGNTEIFIYPPYEFKMVDALLTNFHMPGLTPIMLVSAFAGKHLTMKAYHEAIEKKYRFFSFGDAMLILP